MYNKQTKTAIMKWRDTHKDDYNEYFTEYMREVYYKKNSDKIKEKRMKKYYLNKELETFRKILL
jgi:hypothetical protein